VRCAVREAVDDSGRLGRIAGVEVGLHWSVLVIGGVLAAGLARGRFPANAPGYSSAEYWAAAVIAAFVFLGCVLAHELGHALVARHEGIGVDGITLWFLGGVTLMTSEPTTPKAELAISGAGPLTNLVLGVVMVGIALALRVVAVSPLLVTVLGWLGFINVVVAVFNALPGAPLDGGRVLHAFVWSRAGDRLRATRAATRAGLTLGAALIVLGLVEIARGTAVERGIWLAFVGWFLRTGARAERDDAEHAEPAHREGDANGLLHGRCIKLAAKVLSRTHIAVHRITGGRVGRRWNGGDVAFITTTGRRTGRPHTTPLACIHHRDGVAVVASNGGSYRAPDWWLNLQHQPVAEVELAGTRQTVVARIADAAEQEPLADSFARAYPRFERYRQRERRVMPVVVLTVTSHRHVDATTLRAGDGKRTRMTSLEGPAAVSKRTVQLHSFARPCRLRLTARLAERSQQALTDVGGHGVDVVVGEPAGERDRLAHLREVLAAVWAVGEMLLDERHKRLGQRAVEVRGHVLDELPAHVRRRGAHDRRPSS
jgi:deazaflavin-dependent oxidoreductase (nitroreductase family)